MEIQPQNKITLISKVNEPVLSTLNIDDLYRIFAVYDNIFKKISNGEFIKAEKLGYADPYIYGLGNL